MSINRADVMLGSEESEVNESTQCLRANEEGVGSGEWRNNCCAGSGRRPLPEPASPWTPGPGRSDKPPLPGSASGCSRNGVAYG